MSKQLQLPEALRGEAGRAWQLILNVNSPWYGAGNAEPNYPVEWPYYNNVQYHLGGPVIMELFNIHIDDYGPINWSGETIIQKKRESEVVESIRLREGESLTRQISHTFSKVTTLEQSTIKNFETEIEAHLGSYESPAGLSIKEKVGFEFGEKFGTEQTETDSFSDTLNLVGPLHRKYIAYRDSVLAQRQTSCQPSFDYGIKIVARFPDTREWKQSIFNSKEEFINFIRGEADDSVGVFQTGFEGQGPKSNDPMAPFFRSHPQPNAQFENTVPHLTWTDHYQSRIEMGLDSQDI